MTFCLFNLANKRNKERECVTHIGAFSTQLLVCVPNLREPFEMGRREYSEFLFVSLGYCELTVRIRW